MTRSVIQSSRRDRRVPACFRPSLDILEDRSVPAVLGSMNLPIDVGQLSVNEAEQVIQAPVTLAGQQAGTITLDLTTTDNPTGDECPILNLEINPIHLNLLGLQVDTSAICLDITATEDQGLLGGLLCDLSGGGLDLGGILGQLTGQVDTLLGRLEGLLDGVLGGTFNVDSVFAGETALQQEGHDCDILNLSLGPVNLDVPLLGVSVDLTNCDDPDGPITVDVTGNRDGLLGGLLCGLADGLGGSAIDPGALIGRVDNLIDRLGDLAGVLDRLNQVDAPRQAEQLINQLTRQLQRAADRVDSLADFDRFTATLDRLIDRADRLLERVA